MGRARKKPTKTLVLADVPERVELRELQSRLSSRRDQIAEIDLEIETLREDLASFESHYNARLAREHDILGRVDSLSRHLERWADLLAREATRNERKQMKEKVRRVDARRQREVSARPFEDRRATFDPTRRRDLTPDPDLEVDPRRAQEEARERDQLKEAYRSLARRFHPDLARTEEERLKHSTMMTRINGLYKAGDVDRLLALSEQAKGADIEDPELTIEEQVEVLRERLEWFEAVTQNLREEREILEASSTCEMMRNVQQADAMGVDLVDQLRVELQDRINRAYKDVRGAVSLMEERVATYNRRGAGGRAITTRRKGEALQRIFDPFADKRLVRIGLEHVAQGSVSPSAKKVADWVEQAAEDQKPLVRLIMLAYVSELSPFPLEGLESWDEMEERFHYLGREQEDSPSLEQALVEADDLVEYGVRRATDKVVHLGMRFRSTDLRDAMPVALQALPVRRILRDVLGVLGRKADCPGCKNEVFPVPLYRLRGLDNMRSSICPECGHTLSSYWMPKGQDVQAVLNQVFLDFELVSEWSFQLARSSVAMQLVPVQVENLTVGDLKRRFVDDIFSRYELEISRGQVHLIQDRKRVPEKTGLVELDQQTFTVRFGEEAELSEADALEMVRHRIRNRFK